MTPIYGITENGIKKTGKDMRVLPKTVIYDPSLSLSLPLEISLTSGMNAIAHAAEGLYAQDGNPIMTLLAEEGIHALAQGMIKLKEDDLDEQARSQYLYGAWLCGTVLGNVGMALHHKLCHTLGGSFNLPHAPTHTIILPHAIAYNEVARPEVTKIITRALGVSDVSAGQALFDLEVRLGLETKLQFSHLISPKRIFKKLLISPCKILIGIRDPLKIILSRLLLTPITALDLNNNYKT